MVSDTSAMLHKDRLFHLEACGLPTNAIMFAQLVCDDERIGALRETVACAITPAPIILVFHGRKAQKRAEI